MNKSSLIKNNKSIIGHVKAYSKKNGSPSIQRAATFGISGRGDIFALNKLSSSAWMVEGGLMESHQRRGYHLPGDNKASQTIHSKDLFVDEEKEAAVEGEVSEMETSSKMIVEAWNQYNGINCAKDREMSMDAFKRIMEEGDQWENQLAEIVVYLNGECEHKMDVDKMEQVLIQSVMREKKTVLDSIAIHFLAEMKEDRGQYTEAVKYYELSSMLGNAASLNSLADLYMQGNKQIKKNQKKAISYLKEASDLGCTVSTMHLYKLHFYGLYGHEKDLSQAISYLEKASDLGDENSLFLLAQITKRPSLLSSILPSGYAKNLSPTSKLNQIIFV